MELKLFTCVIGVLVAGVMGGPPRRLWLSPDELDNHISPEDLRDFLEMAEESKTTPLSDLDSADMEPETLKMAPVPSMVDCFGLGSVSRSMMKFLNMKPDDSKSVNTHFFFSSRKNPRRVQVYPGEQFGLDWVDFRADRRTVMIVHGFMSHSNASWVTDMANAFLEWGDVNVFAVDWSGGGSTWKYWRAVANTRRVGADIHKFLKQLIEATGAKTKDFHFVGHSLGAHISSFASHLLGGVARITGLDPAQPCFATSDDIEKLDASDAAFVDIIHTNGRMLKKFGFGMPEPMGDADFYPNGGLRQPGCVNSNSSMWSRMISSTKIQQAVCSHGRAYVLFTESLINNNCSFRAHRWDLSYQGVNKSLNGSCELNTCAEMGIGAVGSPTSRRAHGKYILLTTDKEPYCVKPEDKQPPVTDILKDLQQFSQHMTTTPRDTVRGDEYADPELVLDPIDSKSGSDLGSKPDSEARDGSKDNKSWFQRFFAKQLAIGTSIILSCCEFALVAVIETVYIFMTLFVWKEDS